MRLRGLTIGGLTLLLAATGALPADAPPAAGKKTPTTCATRPTTRPASRPAPPPERPLRIAVVVNPKNPIRTVSMGDLRRIFLRQKTKWPNRWKIKVYEQHTRHRIRSEFSRIVLGKKPNQLNEYWLNLKLTQGLKPPRTCRSSRLLKQYLKRVKGGIGYLYEHEVDKTVKVIRLIELDRRGG